MNLRLLLGVGLLGYTLWWQAIEGRYFGTRLVFIQVGQGDSTLFQSGGRTFLIDTGPRVEGFDAGERLVAPELYRLGVKSLDAIVITHPDMDHAGGLLALSRRFPVGKVVIPDCFRRHQEMLRLLSEARIAPTQISWASLTQTFIVGSGYVRIDTQRGTPENENDGSAFVHIAVGRSTALLTGDASIAAEDAILTRNQPWRAEILKAGHHGSASSTGERLLERARPSYVIFSCGRLNIYGHPSTPAWERAAESGAELLRTDKDGTIIFEATNDGFKRSR